MRKRIMFAAVSLSLFLVTLCPGGKKYRWEVHDMNRPRPRVVTPAAKVGQPPSDAIVLFDGTDLSKWEREDGKKAAWKVENGYMEVTRTGDILTRQAFGDCQLHIEWATPTEVKGEGQWRGNSGVFFMNNYELQILDSYQNDTFADGQAAGIFGQYPPLVNSCRTPGRWQSYDVIFHRPIFGKDGSVIRPATMTVFHNGILALDNVELEGTTTYKKRAKYTPHPDKMPLKLQDHSLPVRFRNIWIRELAENQQ